MTVAPDDPADDKTRFYGVLCDEAKIVTARRLERLGRRAKRNTPTEAAQAADGDGSSNAPAPAGEPPAAADPTPWTVRVARLLEDGKPVSDDRGQPVPCMTSDREIVGLSLSGGGVRSASFCLGVLQGLDAVVPGEDRPQILDAVDYLSTVSGGGYMGASLVSGMLQSAGRFPFTSKFDQMETLGTQHLRDYSNYLAPGGVLDWVVGAVVLLRGLLINAALILSLVLAASAVTAGINGSEDHLGESWIPGPGWQPFPFLWTAFVFGLYVVIQVHALTVSSRSTATSGPDLQARERAGTLFAAALLVCGIVVALEVQSFVLRGMFDAAHLHLCVPPPMQPGPCSGTDSSAGWLGRALYRMGLGSGAPWTALMAAVGTLGAFGSKLVKVAGATFGDRSWSGFLMHWGSRIAIALGSLVVPLAIWVVCLSLSFAAVRWNPSLFGPGCCVPARLPNATAWTDLLGQEHVAWAYAALSLVLLAACCLIPINANSLHGYYRDRLSRAFLWSRDALRQDAVRRDRHPPGLVETLFGIAERTTSKAPDPDRLKLSGLVPAAAGSPEAAPSAPYLLVNTAMNVEGSRYANRRGRNADSFTFAALHSGSAATGYAATATLEEADPHLDLATAMAISGAAASANMGASTIRPLTFSLAVLNVRLGYWLPNPRRVARGPWRPDRAETLWPLSFAKEAFGLLNEWSPLVYLTDGGHFDNLGIYELLKRRCKVIVTADAEADLPMNFESLIRLERCARIDLGVRIDLPWEDLRRWSRKITVDDPHGPDDDVAACIGPHVAVGRIQYTEHSHEDGVLIYIKACISGDENDLIRDYRRRNPDFPHETTLDQFFTEEQFEVYRALGFHATKSFFSGQDRFGFSPSHPGGDWTALVRTALERLNVPADAIARIVAQHTPKPVKPSAASLRRRWLRAPRPRAGRGAGPTR